MLPAEYVIATFWDKPARERHGDPSADDIHRAVGATLSQWEQLETALSGMFAVLVESKSQAASRAYGSIISANGRLQAMDCAAEVFFETHGGDHGQAYKSIIKAVGYGGARRNEIAHGIAVMYAALEQPGGGYYLVPPDYSTRKTEAFITFPEMTEDPFGWTRHKYAYTSNQISGFAERFLRLEREVLNVSRALVGAQ